MIVVWDKNRYNFNGISSLYIAVQGMVECKPWVNTSKHPPIAFLLMLRSVLLAVDIDLLREADSEKSFTHNVTSRLHLSHCTFTVVIGCDTRSFHSCVQFFALLWQVIFVHFFLVTEQVLWTRHKAWTGFTQTVKRFVCKKKYTNSVIVE